MHFQGLNASMSSMTTTIADLITFSYTSFPDALGQSMFGKIISS